MARKAETYPCCRFVVVAAGSGFQCQGTMRRHRTRRRAWKLFRCDKCKRDGWEPREISVPL